MKILYVILLICFTVSCSSEYTPSENVLSLKNNMTEEKAIEELQKAVWDNVDPQGVCGARGFWYDINSKMEVHKNAISMIAHKRGDVISTHAKKIGEVIVFERDYYKYDFEFSGIESINVYKDARLLPAFPECNKKNVSQAFYIIDLYVDKKSNLKFIVYSDNLDKTLAALMLIIPKPPIYLY